MSTLPENPLAFDEEPLTAGTMHYHQLLTGSDWIEHSLVPLAVLATVSVWAAASALLLLIPF